NLLCRPFGAETANGCLVLNRRGTTAERHERELKHLRILCTRFSEARRESFCPLDTDLSWMCRPFGAETANGCLVLNRRGTTAEWHERDQKPRSSGCTSLSG